MSVTCDLVRYNSTTSQIIADVQTVSSSNILPDVTKYDISITRLKADISNAPIMLINPTDESTSIELQLDGSSGASGSDTTLTSGPVFLQDDIYSPGDFIEDVNKALAKCYYQLLQNYTATRFKTTAAGSAGTPLTWSQAASSNSLVVTAPPSGDSGVCYLTFELLILTATAGTYYHVDLENPAGKICRVASNVLLQGGFSYQFAVHGTNQSSITDGILTPIPTVQGFYAPVDSFLKFNDSPAVGTWKVHVSNASQSGSYTVTGYMFVTTICKPQSTLPYGLRWPSIPPSISYDEQNYISWVLHERYFWNHFKIKLGSKLQNILRIDKKPSQFLKLPDQILSTAVDQVIIVKQELPCLCYIAELNKLLINSGTLNINRDYTSNDNRSNAIFSLQLDTDSVLNYNTVEYDNSSEPWRRYPFNTSGELQSFNISLQLQYVDGTIRDLYLQPKQGFNVLVSFLSK
jgi:hypothetical protein